MKHVDKDMIIDVEYKTKEEHISNESVYYTCSHVSQLLDVPEDTIKDWVKYFNSIIDVPTKNLVRRYTKQNIQQLAFIKKLVVEDGLDYKGAMEHCQKHGFQMKHSIIVSDTQPEDKSLSVFESIIEKVLDKKIAEINNSIADINSSINGAVTEIQNQKIAVIQEIYNAKNELLNIGTDNSKTLLDVKDSIEHSHNGLESKIDYTNSQLQNNVEKIVNDKTEAINRSLEDYQKEVAITHSENMSEINNIKKGIEEQHQEMKSNIQQTLNSVGEDMKEIKNHFNTVSLEKYKKQKEEAERKSEGILAKIGRFLTKELD